MLDRTVPPVAGDAQRLQQVIWNLLSNAVKFTPRDGRVQVHLQRANAHVELTVSDTGEGIYSEFLPFLFERFRQADSALSRTHGGLGSGWDCGIWLRRTAAASPPPVRAGAQAPRFASNCRCSMYDQAMDRDARVHASTDPMSGPAPQLADLSGVRVLLVDDDADALEMAKDAVSAAGATAITARDASEALTCLDLQPVDVVVLDIGLPDVDGYELLRRIRERPSDRNGTVPAAALTAYARVADRTRSLQGGFQMHIGKPVQPIELVAAIRWLADAAKGNLRPGSS